MSRSTTSATSVIGQLCVGALVQGPLTPVDAIFQNVDKEPFTAGGTGSWTVCGGELTSQSSAPVQLFFDAGSGGRGAAGPLAEEREAGDRAGAERIVVRA